MTRKKIGNEGEMKKLLNELSAKEALQVKGGNAPIKEDAKGIKIGITITF